VRFLPRTIVWIYSINKEAPDDGPLRSETCRAVISFKTFFWIFCAAFMEKFLLIFVFLFLYFLIPSFGKHVLCFLVGLF
jgi:hypothetical protein